MNNPDLHSDEYGSDEASRKMREAYENSAYNFSPSFINVWSAVMNSAVLEQLRTSGEIIATENAEKDKTSAPMQKILYTQKSHFEEQSRKLEGEPDHYPERQPKPEAIAQYNSIVDEYNGALSNGELTPRLAQQFADKMVTLIYGNNPYNHKNQPGKVRHE